MDINETSQKALGKWMNNEKNLNQPVIPLFDQNDQNVRWQAVLWTGSLTPEMEKFIDTMPVTPAMLRQHQHLGLSQQELRDGFKNRMRNEWKEDGVFPIPANLVYFCVPHHDGALFTLFEKQPFEEKFVQMRDGFWITRKKTSEHARQV